VAGSSVYSVCHCIVQYGGVVICIDWVGLVEMGGDGGGDTYTTDWWPVCIRT
jgi:hypothetical protein